MNFVEFAGFIAMLLLVLNSMRENKKRRENPEDFEEEEHEQAERLKAFLRGVNDDMQEMPTAPPKVQAKPAIRLQPKPAPVQHQIINAPLKSLRKDHSEHIHTPYMDAYATDEKDPYAHSNKDAYAFVKRKKIRAESLMRRLKTSKDMVLWHEIIGPPTALKNERSSRTYPH
jgi:hypothetical protein